MGDNSDNAGVQIGAGGIIEISAVATLIGAPVAEALTVGLKSAIGLPWASISSFGLLHVAKAAMAAAIPDWLRDPLGLSNGNVDLALGQQQVLLENKVASRTEMGDPVAIAIERSRKQRKSHRCSCSSNHIFGRTVCLYSTDRYSSLVLSTIPESDLGKEVLVHQFIYDPGHNKKTVKGWMILLFSAVKVAEMALLRCLGANELWIFTALPWIWGFVSSIVLILSHGSDKDEEHVVDIATGHLPSALTAGGRAKIVLGLPANPRRSWLWTLTWSGYSAVVLCGLVGTYVVLGKNTTTVIYTWIGTQAAFLALRTLVYYLLDSVYGQRHGLAQAWAWDQCGAELRGRTLDVLLSVAAYQETTHPRGARTYATDLACRAKLASLLLDLSWEVREHWTAPSDGSAWPTSIRLLDVVGDNLLRAGTWLHGATLPNNDLYDSALAFVAIDGHKQAIPVVRVMTCQCKRPENEIYPRGDSHGVTCVNMRWFIWIPVKRAGEARHDSTASTLALLTTTATSGDSTPSVTESISSKSSDIPKTATILTDDEVTSAQTSEKQEVVVTRSSSETTSWLVLGTRTMKQAESPVACEYMSDRTLSKKLGQKEWRISLTTANEFHDILAVSRQAAALLVGMVRSTAAAAGGEQKEV